VRKENRRTPIAAEKTGIRRQRAG